MNCATCRLPLSEDGVCLGCALSGTVGGEEAAAEVRRFAGYELLEEIGQEGGMGSVFKARDSSSGRLVALKMLRADRLRSEELIRRFQIEVEAAANLDHPHVLPIHDVGEHHGQHYYTMRLAGGGSLARQMGLGMWTVSGGDRRASRGQQERIARLMRAVAEGVQHAHERGVLHRDLKPGNILLDEDGTAYVSDFGLAKQLHTDSELTRTQGMVGTPAYMAPEQAQSGGRDVTARTDVWALGVILYELLTGRVPFEGSDALEVLERVRTEEAAAPRGMNPWIERDLEVVCLKCLEKDPRRRYGTAGELAADLGCYLESMPISARAPTQWERVVKWWRRNPVTAPLVVGTAVVLVAGIAGTSWQWRRAANAEALANQRAEGERQQREQATEERNRALETAYSADMASAFYRLYEENDQGALSILDSYVPQAGGRDFRGFEWHLMKSFARRSFLGRPLGDEDGFNILADSVPGGLIASGHIDGTVRIWKRDGDQWHLSRSLPAHSNRVVALSMSGGDRPLVATGGDDGFVRLWDALSGERILELRCVRPQVTLSKDGRSLITSSETGLWGWSANGEVRHLDIPTGKAVFVRSGGTHAVSSEGGLVAHAGESGITVCKADGSLLADLEGGELINPLACNSITFASDDSMLVATSWYGTILCWDLRDVRQNGWELRRGRLVGRIRSPDQVRQLRWDPIGTRLLVATGNRLHALPASSLGPVGASSATGIPEELELQAGSTEGVIRCRTAVHSVAPIDAEWGKFLVGHSDGTSSAWKFPLTEGLVSDPGSIAEGLHIPDEGMKPVLDQHNLVLYAVDSDGRFVRWSAHEEGGPEVVPGFEGAMPIAVLPSSRRLITRAFRAQDGQMIPDVGPLEVRSEEGTVLRQVELPAGRGDWPISASGQTPEGSLVAIGTWVGQVALLDTGKGSWKWAASVPSGVIQCVQLSPDTRHLAVATRDDAGVVLDAATGLTVATLRGHRARLKWFVFAPDGSALYSGGFDTTIRIWDTSTWREVGVLRGHSQGVVMVDISPDGRTLASLGDDHTVRLWSPRTRTELVQWALSGNEQEYVAFAGNRGLLLPNPRGGGVLSWRPRP